MKAAKRVGLGVLGLIALAAIWLALNPASVRRGLVERLSDDYTAPGGPVAAQPAKAGSAAMAVDLERIASGIEQPTDIQFSPAVEGYALVAAKQGSAHWLSLADGRHGVLWSIDVVTVSEQGLLGLAFHPRYGENGRLFSNHTVAAGGRDVSRVVEWRVTPPGDLERAEVRKVKVLMEVAQPYQNHNAGQLAFGPDGMLYVGWGDGGFRDDPEKSGQDPSTFLGSMLRIDVDRPPDEGRAYAIPKDNPFRGKKGFAPELFAYGLRNPWRYSFDPRGRLVVADVGQDTWEEVDLVAAGDNLGWRIKEGFACYVEDESRCKRDDLVDPIHVYGRRVGKSVTGGYVYLGKRIGGLHGKYVFGDFVSGRLFALELPDERKRVGATPLGKWPLLISTFGRDPAGELYLGAYGRGQIYRLVADEPDDEAPP